MKTKTSSKITLTVIFILAFLIVLILSFSLAFFIEHGLASKKYLQINSESYPRLKIPKININSTVKFIGLTSDGSIGVPKNPADVAWFNLGVYPGEVGNAIISGHAGWEKGKPAVFDNLYKLNIGDQIYIENKKGQILIFIIREIRIYSENQNTSSVFVSGDNKSHLNLITCGGVWNSIDQNYSERIVIFSDKVE